MTDTARRPLPAACAELLVAGELAIEMLEYVRHAAADRLLPQDIADLTAAEVRWRLASDAFIAATEPQEDAA